MTNNYNNNKPILAKKTYRNIKKEAKRVLASENCRATLIGGSVIGTAFVGISMFLATSLLVSSPTLMNDSKGFLSLGILLFVSAFFILFFFSPIYCGMYNVALKAFDETPPETADLFRFYMSPRLYRRSIRIFLSSFWFIYVFILLSGAVYFTLGLVDLYLPSYLLSFSEVLGSLQISYVLFASIPFFAIRKSRYLYIPMAVENTEISLRECSLESKRINHISFRMYLPGDTSISLLLTIASVFTIGILYIIYVAPLAVAKKAAYYKLLKID